MKLCIISTSYSNMFLFQHLAKELEEFHEVSCFSLSKNVSDDFSNFKHLNLSRRKSFDNFIERYSPDCVICDISDHIVKMGRFLNKSKAKQIPTIVLAERFNQMYYQFNEFPDFVLTSNKHVKEGLQKDTNVVMYDNLLIDFKDNTSYSYNKVVDYENPKILYISQNKKLFYGYFVLREFRSLIDNHHKIYVKTHYKDMVNKWKSVVSNVEVLKAQKTEEVIEEMLLYDLVIGDDSELLFIASSLGIPTIFYENKIEEHINDFFINKKHVIRFIPEHYRKNSNKSLIKEALELLNDIENKKGV